jgi:adenylate cyclase
MIKFFKKFGSLNPTSITTGLLILVLAIYSYGGIPILNRIELQTYDQRLIWRGDKKPSPIIVAAVLDEKSLDKEGRWPWPRKKIAELIDRLSEDGAKVIGFDFFFTEPDKNSNLNFINQFEKELKSLNMQNRELESFIEREKQSSDNDRILARSIRESKAKVILPYFFHLDTESLGYEIDKEELDNRVQRIINSVYPLTRYGEGAKGTDPLSLSRLRPYAPEVNLEILSQAATNSGYINNQTFSPISEDGIIRDIPIAIKFQKNIFVPFSVQCVWYYLDQPNLIIDFEEYGLRGLTLGDLSIPSNEIGELLVNYLGPPGVFPRYSITDILHGDIEKGTFKDKIVIVGSIAVGAHDLRHTPFSSAQPGMEIHMTVMDNILRNDFISEPDWTKILDVLAIVILGILMGIIIPRSGPIMGLSAVAILFICHIVFCFWLFSQYGLWIDMVMPLLTLFLVYTSLTAYHYLVEERNKRFLHSTFSSYLSPELINDMVTSETMPELGGEARIITAYFTDIQRFSVFSEKLTANQLVELLNEYLSAMTDILISERGTLDKYEGDAIIAFLGAPMVIPDHTLRACRVAIDMQGELRELREKWKEEKQLPDEPNRNSKNLTPDEWIPGDKWPKVVHNMMMRIGINSGEMVVGNMGSTMRMNYTMMGDSVNLAARLEAGAKQYGIYTVISEYTLNMEYINEKGEKERAIDHVEARFIDNITVVGKTEPVKIYELCAMKGDLTPKEKELFDLFDRGMRHYLRMQWDAAIDLFRESLKVERFPEGKTTPSEVFIKRCAEFKENPPVRSGKKWDGVYRMTQK